MTYEKYAVNSKQRRKKERAGFTIKLQYKRQGVIEAYHEVTFKKSGAGKFTCGGHTISIRKRYEPNFPPERYYFFVEAARICDTLHEIHWTLEYEYGTLWEYMRDQ